MASKTLDDLRAARAAAAEQPQAETLAPELLDAQLDAARASSAAAHNALQEQRGLVDHCKAALTTNAAAIAQAKTAAAKAVLARKTPAAPPADLSDALESAKAEAQSKLSDFEGAVGKADALLARAEAAVRTRAEADKRAALAAELEPLIEQLKQKIIASGLGGDVQIGSFALKLKRHDPIAASNRRETISMERTARGDEGRLQFVAGRAGSLEASIAFTATTEPEPATPDDVLTVEQCAAQNVAELEARRAAREAEKAAQTKQSAKEWERLQEGLTRRVGKTDGSRGKAETL